MLIKQTLIYLWAGPTTAVGLVATTLAVSTGGRARVVDGVLEVHGGFAAFALRRLTLLPNGAAAMTLGHVVLGQDAVCLAKTRRHERVHVRQCERWGRCSCRRISARRPCCGRFGGTRTTTIRSNAKRTRGPTNEPTRNEMASGK